MAFEARDHASTRPCCSVVLGQRELQRSRESKSHNSIENINLSNLKSQFCAGWGFSSKLPSPPSQHPAIVPSISYRPFWVDTKLAAKSASLRPIWPRICGVGPRHRSSNASFHATCLAMPKGVRSLAFGLAEEKWFLPSVHFFCPCRSFVRSRGLLSRT